MQIATVNGKGQATLNKEMMRHLGIPNGGKVSFEKLPNNEIHVAALERSNKMDNFAIENPEGNPPTKSLQTPATRLPFSCCTSDLNPPPE